MIHGIPATTLLFLGLCLALTSEVVAQDSPVPPVEAASQSATPAPSDPQSSQAPAPQDPARAAEIEPLEGFEVLTANDPVVELGSLVEVGGVRSNQLVGVGVVVGLNGTGDSSIATRRAVSNFVRNMGLNVLQESIASANCALVSVTANLGPFPAPDTVIDVQVQSIGDSSSLFGGTLVQAPLRGADRQVYVVAQGSVTVGGFQVSGQAASVTQNHPLAGVVVDGGMVEKGIPMTMMRQGHMELHLRHPNYRTAARVAERLNDLFPGAAMALNKRTIRIKVPRIEAENPVGFFAQISALPIRPSVEAVVVVNERTGTLIAGHQVRISRAAITHGDLTISVMESPVASQPAPFSGGETVVLPRTEIDVNIESAPVQVIGGGTTVVDLASAFHRLGVPPRDLVSILLALKRAGHLHARVEVM